jgi:hypothetical protein
MEEGIHQIDSATITAIQNNENYSYDVSRAAYFIIAAYDVIARSVDTQKSHDRIYYAFGHLGALSQAYRDHAAYELYLALCDIKERYSIEYESVSLIIEAHSHGGNIVLKLHEKEQLHKRGLFIQSVTTWGMPIQYETAHLAAETTFGRVFNCYARHDTVQTIDALSTTQRKSHKTLWGSSLISDSNASVYDILLLVNDNEYAIGHMNMWLLTHSYPRSRYSDPLPFVVFSPIMHHLASNTVSFALNFQLIDTADTFYFALHPQEKPHDTSRTYQEQFECTTLLESVRTAVHNGWSHYKTPLHRLWLQREARCVWRALKDYYTA